MNELPEQEKLPAGLSREKPAKNVASLATTEALRGLMATALAQWKKADKFTALAKYGIRPIDRMLFWGPPGNGKTMASQWIAAQLGVPLFRVRCEALIGSLMGVTTRQVGALMEWLDRQPRCVVLFDEVELLFPSREFTRGECDREMNNAMGVFWQYLDRWEAPTLFVLATNLPDRLDPALLSRIDLKLEFGPPTHEQACGVIRYWQEVLHEYGSDTWGPKLMERGQFRSFRALFQEVQHQVRMHVTHS